VATVAGYKPLMVTVGAMKADASEEGPSPWDALWMGEGFAPAGKAPARHADTAGPVGAQGSPGSLPETSEISCEPGLSPHRCLRPGGRLRSQDANLEGETGHMPSDLVVFKANPPYSNFPWGDPCGGFPAGIECPPRCVPQTTYSQGEQVVSTEPVTCVVFGQGEDCAASCDGTRETVEYFCEESGVECRKDPFEFDSIACVEGYAVFGNCCCACEGLRGNPGCDPTWLWLFCPEKGCYFPEEEDADGSQWRGKACGQ
jgi:hypothetical protein